MITPSDGGDSLEWQEREPPIPRSPPHCAGEGGRLPSPSVTARETCLYPSGRLVVRDRQTDVEIEPEFRPSIGIVSDPAQGMG